MSDLNAQIRARQELSDRAYRQQDKEYAERRQAELAAQLATRQRLAYEQLNAQLAAVQARLDDVQARLTRAEEVLSLNDAFYA